MAKTLPPIPAFYACYLLRSTVRHASLYVGSTPNPVRRLNQHNGKTKGGAVKTSRDSLRPWEMTCLVTGFPSKIAALQFEWAWQNTHITRHISPNSRLTNARTNSRLTNARTNVRISPKTGRPRKRPAKPRLSLTDRLANLHLLLGSSSFRRWPLKVTFYAQDVFRVWQRWTAQADVDTLPSRIEVILDASISGTEDHAKAGEQPVGIYALSVDYSEMKPHIEKTTAAIEASSTSVCSICKQSLSIDGQAILFCPHDGCHGAGHLECFATTFTSNNPDTLIPTSGSCPCCGSVLQWIDLVKELSLRMRGEKEIQKVLKVRKARATKKGAVNAIADQELADDEDVGLDGEQEEEEELDDRWHELSESESEVAGPAVRSDPGPVFVTPRFKGRARAGGEELVIEDSEWEEAMVLT